MRSRTAFTLVEVMVAIVITGVVALLAYGSAQAGFDTSDRLNDYRRGPESEALMRSVVSDALRHISSAPAGGPPSFRIEHRDASSDVLTFVTRGVTSPLGAGSLWKMTLLPSDSGLQLRADPLEDSSVTPIRAIVRRISAMKVLVESTDANQSWTGEWSSDRQVPTAVVLQFAAKGTPAMTPLIVSVSPDSYR